MSFDVFGSESDRNKSIKYEYRDSNRNPREKIVSIDNNYFTKTLNSNLLFSREDIEWYTKFNRYGYLDPFNNRTANREYLFFTKPDLRIFDNTAYNALSLVSELQSYPIFVEAAEKYKPVLTQLQSSVRGKDNLFNPFMCLLSNAVNSRLDLPGLSSETNESSSNMYGTSIQYRSHSIKSDNGFDFTLSFNDSIYLEVYMLAKLYDEYIRLQKMGKVSPHRKYIINKVLPDQFSIYKFIVGDDGESIIYYARATGVFITDVPRGDLSDPAQDGFKFSLSFHSQFIEDMNPMLLYEFNRVANPTSNNYMKVYDLSINGVNNEWAKLPCIVKVRSGQDARASANALYGSNGSYTYLLKWL